jgi:hypothetical protein
MASVHARPVIPHVFPEIHVHLGAAFPSVAAVETTVPEYEIDVLYRLFPRLGDDPRRSDRHATLARIGRRPR